MEGHHPLVHCVLGGLLERFPSEAEFDSVSYRRGNELQLQKCCAMRHGAELISLQQKRDLFSDLTQAAGSGRRNKKQIWAYCHE